MARHNEFTDAVDIVIAKKINQLRILLGLSGQQLAKEIGVTHQQLQKYEKGTNRITAGRLAAIALALGKPVSYFFEDINQAKDMPTQHQRMCIEVSRNFLKIKSSAVQISINNHVRTLAQNN